MGCEEGMAIPCDAVVLGAVSAVMETWDCSLMSIPILIGTTRIFFCMNKSKGEEGITNVNIIERMWGLSEFGEVQEGVW